MLRRIFILCKSGVGICLLIDIIHTVGLQFDSFYLRPFLTTEFDLLDFKEGLDCNHAMSKPFSLMIR